MYAYATIEPRNDGKIEIVSIDRKESLLTDAKPYLEIDGKLDLIKGVYNRIVKDFNKGKPLAFTIYT
jgi:D-glycero-alpha-D-manno-heptose-7-phosphate kinase